MDKDFRLVHANSCRKLKPVAGAITSALAHDVHKGNLSRVITVVVVVRGQDTNGKETREETEAGRVYRGR